jgi:hypothetical protein
MMDAASSAEKLEYTKLSYGVSTQKQGQHQQRINTKT